MINQPNDMMFRVFIRLIAIIVVTFSIYLFFSGHNAPGGGFIGGLMTAIAILVMYLVFGTKTMNAALPFNYPYMMSIGLLVAAGTGIISVAFGYPYLKQFFDYFQIPIFGEVELTTALIFDLGVYLLVVGSAMTFILSIVEDDS
ncbi:Na(+)/H(+) antiporter subunit B [Lacicoccus alkaliphilus]|uniref:Multisubunit sodium/proton antiporter, MrpB subunit n=1 Tax=Lacicoccus alkaliphilus DSM 16010 TaxID=1123231 RepID=A0A1M7FIW4_9BACL|nr:Na(+)/H(+) antiporter subunit B [Salinicoccus alkaliphilus]SHM03933.1 multisubunit sodium/proton antiporter, MrpB subunit [Salinicoccus alkaliphilus DSM 16010]